MNELTDHQCALMILRSLEERGLRRRDGKVLTRARLTGLTLKRLCNRKTINQDWIDRVNESLMKAGWLLIDAGITYGAVKISVVENWPRAISGNLKPDLENIKKGNFDFDALERLMDEEVWETTTHLRGRRGNQSTKTKN